MTFLYLIIIFIMICTIFSISQEDKQKIKYINRIDNENPGIRKRCGICKYYCTWFGDCFCKIDTGKDPLKHGFQGDNYGNKGGICKLFEFK